MASTQQTTSKHSQPPAPVLTIFMESPIGTLRIGAGSAGICEVHFLNSNEITDMITEFPWISIGKDGHLDGLEKMNQSAINDCSELSAKTVVVECYRQLESYLNGTLQQFDLPLAQPGTSFQIRVWEQLTKINYGNTVSYLTVAKRLGDPKMIRAAATANGKNNIAIIVPCHRVIGSSGELVGYAGGLSRKKWLLEHEQRFAHGLQTLF